MLFCSSFKYMYTVCAVLHNTEMLRICINGKAIEVAWRCKSMARVMQVHPLGELPNDFVSQNYLRIQNYILKSLYNLHRNLIWK